MFKYFGTFALAALASVSLAQSPAQWRYTFENGIATATYPGNVVTNGSFSPGTPMILFPTPGTTPSDNEAIIVSQTVTGTGNGFQGSSYYINDDSAQGVNFSTGFYFRQLFGGAAASGGRSGLWVDVRNDLGATDPANPNRNYAGIHTQGWASESDGGTGLTIGTAKGAFFGIGSVGIAAAGATNLLNVTGGEFNTSVRAGASVAIKTVLQLVGQDNDATGGTIVDAMLGMWDQNGAGGHNDGILIDDGGGTSQWPIKSTGNLFRTDGGTVANGFNISSTTITGNAFISNGFAVTGTGAVTSALSTVTAANPVASFVDTANSNREINVQQTASCLRVYDQTANQQTLNVCLAGITANSIRLIPTTVGALPTCNGGLEGTEYAVTDNTGAVFNAAIAAGGGDNVKAYCNGTGWVVR